MATSKTYNTVGTSSWGGVTKVRFGNDFVTRFKILDKNGHEDIQLVDLEDDFNKGQCLKMIVDHPKFQSDEQQAAIYDFVINNAYDIGMDLKETVDF